MIMPLRDWMYGDKQLHNEHGDGEKWRKSVSDVNWRMALYDVAKSRTAHWRWEFQTKSCSLQRDVERKQLKANERHQ